MAANRFASMLHRNTNNLTLILTYALLEWILILLLLLNSLFSYIILKFSLFFGLNPPCFFCSTIHPNLHTDHLCESHATQISKFVFCPNHRKLSEFQNLSQNCLSESGQQINGEVSLIKTSSWDVLECSQKENRTLEVEDVKKIPICKEKEALTMEETSDLIITDDKSPVQIQHLEFCLDYSGHTLVLVDDSLVEDCSKKKSIDIAFIDVDINEEPQCLMEIEEDENSLVFSLKSGNLVTEEFGSFGMFPLVQWPSAETHCIQELANTYLETVACEEVAWESNGNEADVSIGTEIPDLDNADELQIPSVDLSVDDDPGCNQVDVVELHSSEGMEESEKVLDTPTSMDSLNHLHKKILMLEKPDFITTEDSVNGSMTGDLEPNDEAVTIERLKSALRAERKALRVLYTELEEERSSSAVAASQTMAMINRLQEEKAAVQMEALQYQRMMEEQAEYDQEALQMLNEIMVKREREKIELERELEGCKKKLLEYEVRAERRGGFMSEDSDGVLIDLNWGGICGYVDHESTPVEAVVDLEESFAKLEEERISILEQLKLLEDRLLTMHDGQNGHPSEDVRETGNGHSNGYVVKAIDNGHPGRLGGRKGKSLLPLFDAISDKNGNENGSGNGYSFEHESCETDSKKLAIEDEVDCLYERLQALEADREFLKHCISSLKKGDRGTDLLLEILQHLRELRSVEIRVRTISESSFT